MDSEFAFPFGSRHLAAYGLRARETVAQIAPDGPRERFELGGGGGGYFFVGKSISFKAVGGPRII